MTRGSERWDIASISRRRDHLRCFCSEGLTRSSFRTDRRFAPAACSTTFKPILRVKPLQFRAAADIGRPIAERGRDLRGLYDQRAADAALPLRGFHPHGGDPGAILRPFLHVGMNEKGGAEIAVRRREPRRPSAADVHPPFRSCDARRSSIGRSGFFPPGVPNSVRDDRAVALMLAEVGNLKRRQLRTSATRSYAHDIRRKRGQGQTAKPRRSLPIQRDSSRTATTARPVASPIHTPTGPSGVANPRARPTGAPIAQ